MDQISIEQLLEDWNGGFSRSLSIIEALKEKLNAPAALRLYIRNAEALFSDWHERELQFFETIEQDFDDSKDELFYYSFHDRRGDDEDGGEEQGYLVMRGGEIRNEYPVAGNLRDVHRVWNTYDQRLGVANEMSKELGIEKSHSRLQVPNIYSATNVARENPFQNGLGMTFVPVRIASRRLLFSQFETRVREYAPFVEATGRQWKKPSFQQLPSHPAVNLTWQDATAFCAWLTKEEWTRGQIQPWQTYRLPSDAEWSQAVGLRIEGGKTPAARQQTTNTYFPWGTSWPPPVECGNYGVDIGVDGFTNTSPAGSFKPTHLGLYDMGGNVWEWCQDWFSRDSDSRVLRGGSWDCTSKESLLSSYRLPMRPVWDGERFGFRCVLVIEQEPAPRLESQKEKFFWKHANLRDYYVAFDAASLSMLEARIRDDYRRRTAIVLAAEHAIADANNLAVVISKIEEKLRIEEKAYEEVLMQIQQASDSDSVTLYYYVSKDEENPNEGVLVVRDGRVDKKFPIKPAETRRN